jgi:hypothetical protein
LSFPEAIPSSRAVPLRRHAFIAEGRALPITNATGVIMHGGNLLTTTATGLITDGRGLPMATLTGLITEAPIITGVASRGRHRSSIRTDRPSRVDCVCRDGLRELLRKKLKGEKIERPRRARGQMWSNSWTHSAKAYNKRNRQGEASGGRCRGPSIGQAERPRGVSSADRSFALGTGAI